MASLPFLKSSILFYNMHTRSSIASNRELKLQVFRILQDVLLCSLAAKSSSAQPKNFCPHLVLISNKWSATRDLVKELPVPKIQKLVF